MNMQIILITQGALSLFQKSKGFDPLTFTQMAGLSGKVNLSPSGMRPMNEFKKKQNWQGHRHFRFVEEALATTLLLKCRDQFVPGFR